MRLLKSEKQIKQQREAKGICREEGPVLPKASAACWEQLLQTNVYPQAPLPKCRLRWEIPSWPLQPPGELPSHTQLPAGAPQPGWTSSGRVKRRTVCRASAIYSSAPTSVLQSGKRDFPKDLKKKKEKMLKFLSGKPKVSTVLMLHLLQICCTRLQPCGAGCCQRCTQTPQHRICCSERKQTRWIHPAELQSCLLCILTVSPGASTAPSFPAGELKATC